MHARPGFAAETSIGRRARWRGRRLPALARSIGWLAVAGLTAFVFDKAFAYRFLVPGRLGPSLWNRQAWFYGHTLFGTLALLLGAAQFSARLRRSRPRVHRWMGRTYVALAVLGSLAGIWLALNSDFPGRRAPLALLGLLWLWFTLDGWRRARARDFAAHRLLMIRSYVVALVFVWARLLAMPPVAPILFGFIADPALREATAIWIAVVGPVLLMQILLGPVPPGRDIPDHAPGDGFEAPKLWRNPSISPSSLTIYTGAMFPE